MVDQYPCWLPLATDMVQHGANVDTQVRPETVTAFYSTLYSGFFLPPLLLLSPPTPSSPSSLPFLPTVEFLISAGANLNAQNIAGEMPFDCTTLFEI